MAHETNYTISQGRGDTHSGRIGSIRQRFHALKERLTLAEQGDIGETLVLE